MDRILNDRITQNDQGSLIILATLLRKAPITYPTIQTDVIETTSDKVSPKASFRSSNDSHGLYEAKYKEGQHEGTCFECVYSIF